MLELDCLRIRTFRDIASWAIQAFDLPTTLSDLPLATAPGFIFNRRIIDMDFLTSLIYDHVGSNGQSYRVLLKNHLAASKDSRLVLDHERGWKRMFGSGLPHDFGVCIGFEP